MKFEVKGSGDSIYEVDTESVTCTCANFKYRCSHYTPDREERLCKHLTGIYSQHPELRTADMVKLDKSMGDGKDPDGKTRYPREMMDLYVFQIKDVLNKYDFIKKYEFCGSYRRLKPTVSDLDVLICIKPDSNWDSMLDFFESVLGFTRQWRGDLKAGYLIDGFVHVDFKIVLEESWSFAQLHFTGPKEYNIELRRIATRKGYKLNEYGLFVDSTESPVPDLDSEQKICEFLGEEYLNPWDRK